MKKFIAAALSILVGAFGYTIAETSIDTRVANLEAECSSLQNVVSSLCEFHNTVDTTTTTEVDETTEATSEIKKPATTEEILKYFNNAVNSVKTDAKSVKQHSIVHYLVEPAKIGDALSSIYKMLGDDIWLDSMLRDNSSGEALYEGKDRIKGGYPVENQIWSSDLSVDDIESATCTDANGVYTIQIITKADTKATSVKYGQGHNPKVFSVVLPGVINDNIPGIAKSITGDAAVSYPSGSIAVTVDAATGHVLTAVYDAHWTIHFDKADTVLPFATKFTYSVDW